MHDTDGLAPEVSTEVRHAERFLSFTERANGDRRDGRGAENADALLVLVRRLIGSNLKSVRLAKDLLLAQELADLQRSQAEPAIDLAAWSEGDSLASERAVDAVAAAERADEAEFGLSREWAAHCCNVYALTELAEEVLERGTASHAAPTPCAIG